VLAPAILAAAFHQVSPLPRYEMLSSLPSGPLTLNLGLNLMRPNTHQAILPRYALHSSSTYAGQRPLFTCHLGAGVAAFKPRTRTPDDLDRVAYSIKSKN
jgi:hypothetical protein